MDWTVKRTRRGVSSGIAGVNRRGGTAKGDSLGQQFCSCNLWTIETMKRQLGFLQS
jgi:hypothetical protein